VNLHCRGVEAINFSKNNQSPNSETVLQKQLILETNTLREGLKLIPKKILSPAVEKSKDSQQLQVKLLK